MSDTKTPFVKPGRNRSFGRTFNRMNEAELADLDARLAPFSLTTSHEKIDLSFVKGPLVLELGMGNGESLTTRASTTPATTFVGCEVFKNGVKTCVIACEEHALKNVRLSCDDARVLLEKWPEKSVDQLVVLYPDPWPKSKHKKRRIINHEFLDLAHAVLKDEGELFLATDIPDYALWMLREVYTHGVFFPTAASPAEWAQPPTWWVPTKYERKATKMGRKPWYITLRKDVDRSNTKCPVTGDEDDA